MLILYFFFYKNLKLKKKQKIQQYKLDIVKNVRNLNK